MAQTGHTLKGGKLKYLLYLPDDYETSDKNFPLILFLHGAGERGTFANLKTQALPKMLELGQKPPFIVVSPLVPLNSWWNYHLDEALAVLDEVLADHRVDQKRVYLTGLSMGGFGAWELAIKAPQRFAAIAPICGWTDDPLDRVCILKDKPVWTFHGTLDEVVPIQASETIVETLKACGGNIKFTVYSHLRHDSWTVTYNTQELYLWFLDHKLS
jgi:predicted peptidase